jgi:hypothetical protein
MPSTALLIMAPSVAALHCALAAPAAAKEPAGVAHMVRMLACEGPDAKMEIFLPQSVASGPYVKASLISHPVTGTYALDLTEANKGKVLEPVRVSLTRDGKTVIVDQYTRKLPPTRIPVGGGTVDFDQRFGTAAKCGPFRAQD